MLFGSAHMNGLWHTPMHSQVGASSHAVGVDTQWELSLASMVTQLSPPFLQSSQLVTREHSDTARQLPKQPSLTIGVYPGEQLGVGASQVTAR